MVSGSLRKNYQFRSIAYEQEVKFLFPLDVLEPLPKIFFGFGYGDLSKITRHVDHISDIFSDLVAVYYRSNCDYSGPRSKDNIPGGN